MTVTQNPYEQYQQGPPPGYGQQPSGYPQGQPGYDYPQNAPAQPGPPPPAPAHSEDEFGTPDPSRPAAGEQPALHQLKGRLMLFWPSKTGMADKFNKAEGQEENVWFEAIVCDGPPIAEHIRGDNDAVTPFAAGPKQAPFFIPSLQSKGAVLDRLRRFTPGGEYYGRPCLGRLVYRPPVSKGKPWPDIEDPTEADKALARQILPMRAQLRAAAEPVRQPQPDSFAPPVQSPGPPPAWAQAPQPQYQQPAGPPPGYAGGGPTPYGQQPPQGPPPGQYPPY